DPQRGVLEEEVAGVQHEASAGLDRPAAQHLHALGVFRQLDLLGLVDDVELYQELGKIDAARRAIDHDAHGAVGGMRAHIDHRALEARIAHHGHGDQQLAIEIAAAGRIVAHTNRLDIAEASHFATRVARSFALRVHPQSTLKLYYILILGDRPV